MISNKVREKRRGKPVKMTKTLQRLYKEGKCSECSVVVTRMDFAKILGKFTKVKIQYESSSTPKTKKGNQQFTSPNTRLKSNENGMVLLRRNAYSQHPVKELIQTKRPKGQVSKDNSKNSESSLPSKNSERSPLPVNNILKENNRLKKTPLIKDKTSNNNNNKILINSNLKQYGIIFVNPNKNNNNENQTKLTLTEILPAINKDIFPSEDWCIDYFPKNDEPKDDKVYDRIAAELEDLMYNEKPALKSEIKSEVTENKSDDFPSIMDILNDSTTDKTTNQSNSSDFKPNLESSDVEAMLLGKSDESKKEPVSTPMDIDNTDMSNLIADVVALNPVQEADNKLQTANASEDIDNPHSPSILDDTLQKGIEEHLPSNQTRNENLSGNNTKEDNDTGAKTTELDVRKDTSPTQDSKDKENSNHLFLPNISTITHVIFRKSKNGKCCKSVTCPKNLKYSIELEGKSVEFIGAPKFISSLEDLQVLLQIVDESDLASLHVLH